MSLHRPSGPGLIRWNGVGGGRERRRENKDERRETERIGGENENEDQTGEQESKRVLLFLS